MAIGSLEKGGYVLHVQKTDADLHNKAARFFLLSRFRILRLKLPEKLAL
jgi:hypothetical protein